MEAAAKLITAIGSLFGAIAWPLAVLAIALLFRIEIKMTAGRVPLLLDRMRKMKIAGVEAELDKVADASEGVKSGDVTPRQIEAAARIAVEADEYQEDLLAKLDKLCLEYDGIRRSVAPSGARTQAMTRVLVKMRALAPALIEHIAPYKGSGSAGSRLAAVAMMQMSPKVADVAWLAERFSIDQPFVFYHAALALQNLAIDKIASAEKRRLIEAAYKGVTTLKAFEGGPDHSTIGVLENLISTLEN